MNARGPSGCIVPQAPAPGMAGRLRHVLAPATASLLSDPEAINALPVEAIPGVLGELERLKAALWARLASDVSQPRQDHLLSIEQAAAKLGVSTDWVYRRAKTLPFVVRLESQLRFSEQGLERFIHQRQRPARRVSP